MHPREIPSQVLRTERELLLTREAILFLRIPSLHSRLELIEAELASRPIQPHELEIAK